MTHQTRGRWRQDPQMNTFSRAIPCAARCYFGNEIERIDDGPATRKDMKAPFGEIFFFFTHVFSFLPRANLLKCDEPWKTLVIFPRRAIAFSPFLHFSRSRQLLTRDILSFGFSPVPVTPDTRKDPVLFSQSWLNAIIARFSSPQSELARARKTANNEIGGSLFLERTQVTLMVSLCMNNIARSSYAESLARAMLIINVSDVEWMVSASKCAIMPALFFLAEQYTIETLTFQEDQLERGGVK